MSSSHRAGPILIVDDAEADVEFTLLALRSLSLPYDVLTCRDGTEALEVLLDGAPAESGTAIRPVFVLLDLKMPRANGFDVLRRVKSDPLLMHIPVVIVTSSSDPKDVSESYRLGANGYVVKPMDFEEYVRVLREVGAYWGRLNRPPA